MYNGRGVMDNGVVRKSEDRGQKCVVQALVIGNRK